MFNSENIKGKYGRKIDKNECLIKKKKKNESVENKREK